LLGVTLLFGLGPAGGGKLGILGSSFVGLRILISVSSAARLPCKFLT